MEGRVFSEQTKTVLLSRHGAGIVSEYKLSPEQELVIRNEESRKEAEARVVGQIGSQGGTYIYGVAFLDTRINFWGLDFPDLSETEKQAKQTLLECSSCHTRQIADHSDLASDVMAVNESIVRYCQKCGSSTLWKEPVPGSVPSGDGSDAPVAAERSAFAEPAWMQSQRPVPAPTLAPVTPPAAPAADEATKEAPAAASTTAGVATKEQENRRKHARMRVNFKACVRRPNSEDDIVACEDMSRGGLRFKSRRQYFEKMLVEVSVPYSPGDQAIFVPAQIVYVQELPEQKVYRYGVMYLRSGR
jgi:PilZ domain